MRSTGIPFIAAFVFFSSCGYKLVKEEAPAINKVVKGEKFTINLPEEHSSGYLWQLSENYDPANVRQINSSWHGDAKGVDFNFQALAAGQTTLNFALRKYTDTAQIKHFVVQITE